jgi:hypothetical protein
MNRTHRGCPSTSWAGQVCECYVGQNLSADLYAMASLDWGYQQQRQMMQMRAPQSKALHNCVQQMMYIVNRTPIITIICRLLSVLSEVLLSLITAHPVLGAFLPVSFTGEAFVRAAI